LKTAGEVVDDMAVRAPAAIKLALGENPKSLYHGKNLAPETRMAIAALIREALFKAERYKNDRRAAEDDEELDPPEFDFKSEALADAFDLNLPFHIHAHRADDIFTGIRIAEEFGIKYSIIHCTDGAKVAKRLGDLHINAIVGPYLTDRSKPELSSQSAATPGILAAAGVCVAITTDHPETPLKYLPLCASIAVKEGMDELSALAAITINPAKILEIEGRVGSITRGKDADIALWSGHPFELTSKPLSVYIKGKRVFNA
jgi:imidazolonepropionase-like amidohydrolase